MNQPQAVTLYNWTYERPRKPDEDVACDDLDCGCYARQPRTTKTLQVEIELPDGKHLLLDVSEFVLKTVCAVPCLVCGAVLHAGEGRKLREFLVVPDELGAYRSSMLGGLINSFGRWPEDKPVTEETVRGDDARVCASCVAQVDEYLVRRPPHCLVCNEHLAFGDARAYFEVLYEAVSRLPGGLVAHISMPGMLADLYLQRRGRGETVSESLVHRACEGELSRQLAESPLLQCAVCKQPMTVADTNMRIENVVLRATRQNLTSKERRAIGAELARKFNLAWENRDKFANYVHRGRCTQEVVQTIEEMVT